MSMNEPQLIPGQQPQPMMPPGMMPPQGPPPPPPDPMEEIFNLIANVAMRSDLNVDVQAKSILEMSHGFFFLASGKAALMTAENQPQQADPQQQQDLASQDQQHAQALKEAELQHKLALQSDQQQHQQGIDKQNQQHQHQLDIAKLQMQAAQQQQAAQQDQQQPPSNQ